jgi:hypothetical protein
MLGEKYYHGLIPGKHTFTARVVDKTRSYESSENKLSWTITKQ